MARCSTAATRCSGTWPAVASSLPAGSKAICAIAGRWGERWRNLCKAFGVEVFKYENNGRGLYIDEVGDLAVAADFAGVAAPLSNVKAPDWLHGLDLKCRRGGEKDFTKGTKVYGLEVFRDVNNGNLIYLGETGTLAVVQPGKKDLKAPTADALQPRWTHGLDLKVRKSGEKDFTPTTRVWGVEVFNDDNTGVTLYLGEVGALSAVTGSPRAPGCGWASWPSCRAGSMRPGRCWMRRWT